MGSRHPPHAVSGSPYYTLDFRHELRRGCLGCAAIAALIALGVVVLLVLLRSR